MKKFIPDIPCPDVLVKPEEDFTNATKYRFISIGNHYLFYRQFLFNVRYIPMKSITRCYIRVDTCSSGCCCGRRATFDYRTLILELNNGKQKRLWLDNEKVLRSVMNELREKNSDIALGYGRPQEQVKP